MECENPCDVDTTVLYFCAINALNVSLTALRELKIIITSNATIYCVATIDDHYLYFLVSNGKEC